MKVDLGDVRQRDLEHLADALAAGTVAGSLKIGELEHHHVAAVIAPAIQ